MQWYSTSSSSFIQKNWNFISFGFWRYICKNTRPFFLPIYSLKTQTCSIPQTHKWSWKVPSFETCTVNDISLSANWMTQYHRTSSRLNQSHISFVIYTSFNLELNSPLSWFSDSFSSVKEIVAVVFFVERNKFLYSSHIISQQNDKALKSGLMLWHVCVGEREREGENVCIVTEIYSKGETRVWESR